MSKKINDTLLFAELVKEAILLEKDYYQKIPGGMEAMQNFYEEILKYAESVKE